MVKWWRLAAEHGHVQAQFNLGHMYCRGQGVGRDYTEAIRLYQLAVAQGHAGAQHMIDKLLQRYPALSQ